MQQLVFFAVDPPLVDLNAILPLIGLIVGPIVTGLVKRILPSIPKMLLPLLSTVVGAVAAVLAGADTSSAALIGGASVGVRESTDQLLKSGAGAGLKMFMLLFCLVLPLGAHAQTETPTNTPTNTRTPTNTPTATNTPTVTPTNTPTIVANQPYMLFEHATCSSTPCYSPVVDLQDGHKTALIGIEGSATVKVQCCARRNRHFLPCVDLTSVTSSGAYTTDAACLFRAAITACTSCRVSAQLTNDPD